MYVNSGQLMYAFSWEDTPEGWGFWIDVNAGMELEQKEAILENTKNKLPFPRKMLVWDALEENAVERTVFHYEGSLVNPYLTFINGSKKRMVEWKNAKEIPEVSLEEVSMEEAIEIIATHKGLKKEYVKIK